MKKRGLAVQVSRPAGTWVQGALAAVVCASAPMAAASREPAPTGILESAAPDGTSCDADDTWKAMAAAADPSPNYRHTTVWTGNVMIVWGGFHRGPSQPEIILTDRGAVYDPATDRWRPTAMAGAPAPRDGHTAVWTGEEMIVWGGQGDAGILAGGARYDPISNRWAPLSTIGAPSPRYDHSAVWTGSEMIVWGGQDETGFPGEGARYDPASDTWLPVATVGSPPARTEHSAVWTGSRMLVWGGLADRPGGGVGTVDTGGAYDPATDAWTTLSTAGAPSARYQHSTVWTGHEMIVWGGRPGLLGAERLDTGGRYDPALDRWIPTSPMSAPQSRSLAGAAWTGREMIVWGGWDRREPAGVLFLQSGGRYDPATDHWTPTSSVDAPSGRHSHSMAWTGSFVLVWGGHDGPWIANTGARYALGLMVDDDGDGFDECAGDCHDGNASVHPGAPEICNTLDDDCSGEPDDPPAPASVGPLLAASAPDGAARLSWPIVTGALTYDLVRGSAGTLASTGGDFTVATESCVASELAGSEFTDPFVPPAGQGVWYLVRGRNCGGAGTYDSGSSSQVGSRDVEIASSAGACP